MPDKRPPPAPPPPDFLREESLFWREHHDRVPRLPALSASARAKTAALREKAKRAVREYFRSRQEPVKVHRLEQIRSSLSEDDFLAAIDVILDDRMTMAGRTAQFEEAWARSLGSAGAIMVNSGSSANLLALAALCSPDLPERLRPGDEVIVPAVAWSTTVFPVSQVGCIPVFVDIDPDTLNIDRRALEKALTPRTRAIVVVHLLGNPCEMETIAPLARRHGLWLVEDCCESHGARIGDRQAGTFGDLSTFSFYFSHHMTTVEGGMVCYRDPAIWHDRLVSLRAHGWVRGRNDRQRWKEENPEIDDRWLFVSPGYNVRPTDINAALGLSQLEKLPLFLRNRRRVRAKILEALQGRAPHLRFQQERPGHAHSAFAFSMLVDPQAPFSRREFQDYLESREIETRPIIGSNFARQPVMSHLPHRVHGSLDGADRVHYHGLMVGNHADVTSSQIDYFVRTVLEFMKRYEKKAEEVRS